MPDEYPEIRDDEIVAADPQRVVLKVLANATLREAKELARGQKSYQPTFHEAGWSIAIETPRGVVGLWSCWLKNQFYLGYPKSVEAIPDEVILSTLGVEHGRPVANRFGDDKLRQWAAFYGPALPKQQGRVWIDHSEWNMWGRHFAVITEKGLETVSYGHDRSRGIYTDEFSHYHQCGPQAPSAEPAVIQPYRDKFLALACKIAERMGGATAVNIDYAFVLVPELLKPLGYKKIRWLKGKRGRREGWGHELVRGEKSTDAGTEMIMLKSGNSLVPWSTIRRVPCAWIDAKRLIELLTF